MEYYEKTINKKKGNKITSKEKKYLSFGCCTNKSK